MPAAYTFYKFKKMFEIVLAIFFMLIILSILTPELEKAKNQAANSIDSSGVSTKAIDTLNSVPDPEEEIKQSSGNFLYRLMNDNPKGFFILALIVTVILFGGGVYLKDARKFARRLSDG